MNLLTEQDAHLVAHLFRSLYRVGERENLLRPGVTLLNQAGNAMDQNRSFSSAGSRHNKHRPASVLDGFVLTIVGNKDRGLRF
jgi:hypothetical protein